MKKKIMIILLLVCGFVYAKDENVNKFKYYSISNGILSYAFESKGACQSKAIASLEKDYDSGSGAIVLGADLIVKASRSENEDCAGVILEGEFDIKQLVLEAIHDDSRVIPGPKRPLKIRLPVMEIGELR